MKKIINIGLVAILVILAYMAYIATQYKQERQTIHNQVVQKQNDVNSEIEQLQKQLGVTTTEQKPAQQIDVKPFTDKLIDLQNQYTVSQNDTVKAELVKLQGKDDVFKLHKEWSMTANHMQSGDKYEVMMHMKRGNTLMGIVTLYFHPNTQSFEIINKTYTEAGANDRDISGIGDRRP